MIEETFKWFHTLLVWVTPGYSSLPNWGSECCVVAKAIPRLCSVSIPDPQIISTIKWLMPLTFRWFVTHQYIAEALGMGFYHLKASPFSCLVFWILLRRVSFKHSAFLTFYKAENHLPWFYFLHELNIAPVFSISSAIFQKFIETFSHLMTPKNLFCTIEGPWLQPITVDQWSFHSLTNILMDFQKRRDIN